MSDTITVRFGEREVVLERYEFGAYDFYRASIGESRFRVSIDSKGHADAELFVKNERYRVGYDDSAQAAADALYTKVLAHRDELNRLIGGGK